MRCRMSSSSTGSRKVTFITEPLEKSMPALKPEFPDNQPGGAIIDTKPGKIISAEIRKYQPRLPTISSISGFLPESGPPGCSVATALG